MMNVRHPTACQGNEQPTNSASGVQQPQCPGGVEVLGEEREEGKRVRHDHGDEVDEVGAQQIAPFQGVRRAFLDELKLVFDQARAAFRSTLSTNRISRQACRASPTRMTAEAAKLTASTP